MASDDDDDLFALREAALATLKKKPASEEAQPIPQLTSSSHSLITAKPAWADDFNYEEHVPFEDHEPATAPFPPLNTPPPQPQPLPQAQPQFLQAPPPPFPPNWRGPRPGVGPPPRGHFNNHRFMRGRGGPNVPNQRVPFVHNHRPPFGQRPPFSLDQRPPFGQNQRLPSFDLSQPPPNFVQNRPPFVSGPPQGKSAEGGGNAGDGSGGNPLTGGGNLIVINPIEPEEEPPQQAPQQAPRFPMQQHPLDPGQRPPRFPMQRHPMDLNQQQQRFPMQRHPMPPNQQPPRFPMQRMPFQGGPNQRGGRGGKPTGRGRGAGNGEAGRGSNQGNPPPAESASKPALIRPQDKYCPPTGGSTIDQAPVVKVHRKKKDKFSRYNSSDEDSDDESEESEEEEPPARRPSVGVVEEEKPGTEDVNDDLAAGDQCNKSVGEAELSLVDMNSSQLDSEREHVDLEHELDEPVIDNLGEVAVPEKGRASGSDLDEEEEDRLLASPSRVSDVGSDLEGGSVRPQSVNDETPVRDESPIKDEPPVTDTFSDRSGTPVKDESFDNGDATPVRDESPERELSPEQTESVEKVNSPEQEKSSSSHLSRHVDKDSDSDSNSDSDSGEDSDSSSGSSSSSSSDSDKDEASKSSNDSESKEAVDRKSDSDAQLVQADSESESEEDRSVRRLPPKRRISKSPKRQKKPSPPKPKVEITPEERARLEARRRKFESKKEVKVSGNTRTISLKGIVSRKPSKNTSRHTEKPSENSSRHKSSSRTVQARTYVSESNDVESHRKHARRKVSVDKPAAKRANSSSQSDNKSESEEEDDEDGGSRSWMREANVNSVRRKPVVSQSLPRSGGYGGRSHREGNRNGGYYRRERGPPRDSRPEVHYSSSDGENSDRKLISIVVPRTSAGQRTSRPHEERNVSQSLVSSRKRTSDSAKYVQGGGRSSPPKSRRLRDYSPGSDGVANISVTISSNQASSNKSHVSVHQRLGKSKKPDKESSSKGRTKSKRDVVSEDEGHNSELEQRIRQIQKKNKAIMRRQQEVMKDRELYG